MYKRKAVDSTFDFGLLRVNQKTGQIIQLHDFFKGKEFELKKAKIDDFP